MISKAHNQSFESFSDFSVMFPQKVIPGYDLLCAKNACLICRTDESYDFVMMLCHGTDGRRWKLIRIKVQAKVPTKEGE